MPQFSSAFCGDFFIHPCTGGGFVAVHSRNGITITDTSEVFDTQDEAYTWVFNRSNAVSAHRARRAALLEE